MPLFGKKDNRSIDYKARLERKLYLAREAPEPVFDLSDCALKNVPSGIFSLCKVFRKECLYLQENNLTSLAGGGSIEDLLLLRVLDLHSNSLQKLPDELRSLCNLRELNVSANKLTYLPESIGEMTKLNLLNVSNNNLKLLPDSLGNLRQLKHLDVRFNKKLNLLPKSLCHAVHIEEILLDGDGFQYPPKDIALQGAQAIVHFLRTENGLEYVPPSDDDDADVVVSGQGNLLSEFEEKDNEFQAKILQLEAQKVQKQQERLALEWEILEQQRRELEFQTAQKNTKDKLLEDLAHHQLQLEGDIMRLQQDRENERQHLVQQIQQAEFAADSVVSQLLAESNLKDSSQLQSLIEQETQEEQRLLASCHDENQALRKRDILSAMEALLEEEAMREAKIREYEKGKVETAMSLLNQELETERLLSEVVQQREVARDGLAAQLLQDEELQRAAVAALLERSDARSWGLVQHVRLVQEQLAMLTALEMKRRQLQLSEQVEELGAKRAALSELLLYLLDEQTARRQRLLETLKALEDKRRTEAAGTSDFWLRQYQRLLDSRGGGGSGSLAMAEMERALDPVLAQYLLRMGVLHCLPLLAQWLLQPHEALGDALGALTERDLIKVGITSEDTRDGILKAVSLYLEERRQRDLKLPSAAEEVVREVTPRVPSAPSAPLQSDMEMESNMGVAECVVCMDNECEMIFIPCGHLCCCIQCSDALDECPMCRAKVEQKIRVILP